MVHSDCSALARVEVSCQLCLRVQSRVVSSKNALRKRGNLRNSKTTNTLSHTEVAWF